jgi:hypothetical protein
MFEKYGRKVYLEIVGFWTPEYLERKLKKLSDIIVANENAKKKTAATAIAADAVADNASIATKVDLFVAINKDLACSSTALSSLSFHVIPKDRLIQYSSDAVPIRPILEYLKSIDKERVEMTVNDQDLRAKIEGTKDVIPIQDIVIIAAKERSTGNKANNGKNFPPEIVLKIALREFGERYMEVAGTHLIEKAKAEKLRVLLANTTKFVDACDLLTQNGIPASCHAELISKLGYDVVWQNMDPNAAVISKREDGKISRRS